MTIRTYGAKGCNTGGTQQGNLRNIVYQGDDLCVVFSALLQHMSNQHLPPGRYADNLNHLSACKAEQCGRKLGNGVVFYLRHKIEQYPDSVGNKRVIPVKLFGTGKEAPLGREDGPAGMYHVRQ